MAYIIEIGNISKTYAWNNIAGKYFEESVKHI